LSDNDTPLSHIPPALARPELLHMSQHIKVAIKDFRNRCGKGNTITSFQFLMAGEINEGIWAFPRTTIGVLQQVPEVLLIRGP